MEGKPLINAPGTDFSRYKKVKLTRQQINKALMDIEDTNPLRDKVSPHHIATILTKCVKGTNKKSEFKFALRQCLLQELNFKVPKSDNEINMDFYLILGYGVNAYYDILLSLCTMFLCISLFCIPIYYTYSRGIYYRD
jgi:hypothetical protein